MKPALFALSLGFVGVILATEAAFAAPQCGPRAAVLAGLTVQFGETRRSIGMAANGMVVEMFANDTSGTWTLTATGPDGQSCLVASGDGYEQMADVLPPKGDPA